MAERHYQAKLIGKLENRFPGCLVIKLPTNYIQGLPDLLVLYYGTWGALEVKDGLGGEIQPNQEYYVDMMNHMSFAAFISPENEREVLDALQQTFESVGTTRIS